MTLVKMTGISIKMTVKPYWLWTRCVCLWQWLPQKHLAGSAVGVLVERVHLEVMLVGCGSLWLDVGPARQKKVSDLKFGSLHFISRGFLKCNSSVKNSQRSIRRWLTWPCQTAPSTSSLFPLFYRRTGSRASLVDGSGRSRTTTEEEEHVSEEQMAGRSVDGNGNGQRKRVMI